MDWKGKERATLSEDLGCWVLIGWMKKRLERLENVPLSKEIGKVFEMTMVTVQLHYTLSSRSIFRLPPPSFAKSGFRGNGLRLSFSFSNFFFLLLFPLSFLFSSFLLFSLHTFKKSIGWRSLIIKLFNQHVLIFS